MTRSTWLADRVVAASLIVLFCALGPRLLTAYRANLSDQGDAGTYIAPAKNLVTKGAFLDNRGNPEVTRTPGYPVFLAILMLSVGEDLRAMLIAQAFVLSFGVVIIYWLARRVLPPLMAFVGAVLAAFSPWGIAHAGLLMTEGLFLVLLAATFFLLRCTEDVKTLTFVLLLAALVGALTAATIFVRPVTPLFVILAAALLVHWWSKPQRALLLTVVMVVCALLPLYLWQQRNVQEAGFNGLSDIAGKATWRYLASRVQAEVKGESRFEVKSRAMHEEDQWSYSIQEADQERWARSFAVFRFQALLAAYSFGLSAFEHAFHPSASILTHIGLSFRGDYVVFAILWGGLLVLAGFGWLSKGDYTSDDGIVNHKWVTTLIVACALLTLASGISFGAGYRLRAPLELVVPLLAGVGLVRSLQRLRIGILGC
jgi:4-amino-4-deoxy-L-arabinose transferase-like glycosyltransferase